MTEHLTTTSAPHLRPDHGALPNNTIARSVPIRQGYELWAETYDDDPNPLLALEERHLAQLLPDLQEKFVLDIACGTGRWLAKLLGGGARAGIGLDFSPAMLRGANTKGVLQGRLVRGDYLALPLRARVADLIICSFAVGHANDVGVLAREFARVARKNADVFITDLHPQGYAQGWRCAFRRGGQAIEIASRGYSFGQIRRAFDGKGFKLAGCYEPCLGEPEKAIFARAGKGHLFESACRFPAILLCHFRRVGWHRSREGRE